MVWLGLVLALLVSAGTGWLMVRSGRRLGFVDTGDDELKIHRGSAIPLGGVGVFVGLHVGLASMGRFDMALLVATSIVFLLGLADDRLSLSPLIRLVVTAGAGLALVSIGEYAEGVLAGIAAVVLVVAVVNAVNMIDGLDTLAATVTSVSALGLALLAAALGSVTSADPVALTAALLGFLIWNLPPARLFLGDNGAYVIGVTLAWAALRLATGWPTGLLGVVAIGVPLFELGVTVLRRVVSRGTLFGGDRDHLYDMMHQSGYSATQVSSRLGLAQVAWSAVVVALAAFFDPRLAALIAVGLAIAIGLGLTTLQVRSLGRRDTQFGPR